MRPLSLWLYALCSLLASFSLAVASPSSSPDSLFQAGRYSQASAAYEEHLKQDGATRAGLANLGNSYYQEGQLGRAILAYERARLLDPRSQDLRQVLDYLTRKTVDRLPSPTSWLRQTGDRLAYVAPLSLWLVLAPLFFALSLAGWVLFALSRQPRTRRLTFYGALASLAIALLSLALVLHWRAIFTEAERQAVLLLPESSIYAEPSAESTVLIKLHEGAGLELAGQTKDGFQPVTLPDGRPGWIASHALEALAPLPY